MTRGQRVAVAAALVLVAAYWAGVIINRNPWWWQW